VTQQLEWKIRDREKVLAKFATGHNAARTFLLAKRMTFNAGGIQRLNGGPRDMKPGAA
jgi:hypothetical protein